MSAQPTLQLVNGTGPSISDVRGDQPPGLEQESGTATDGARAGGEAGNGEAGLTREDPALATRQSREVTDTSPGDLPRASGRERTMQEAFLGTRDSDPAQASGIVRGSGNVQPSSQMVFDAEINVIGTSRTNLAYASGDAPLDDEAWIVPELGNAGRSLDAESPGGDSIAILLSSRWRELRTEIPTEERATATASRIQLIFDTCRGNTTGSPETTWGDAE